MLSIQLEDPLIGCIADIDVDWNNMNTNESAEESMDAGENESE